MDSHPQPSRRTRRTLFAFGVALAFVWASAPNAPADYEFARPSFYPTGGQLATSVAVSEFNVDGQNDVVAGTGTKNGQLIGDKSRAALHLLLGAGTGSLGPGTPFPPSTKTEPRAVATGLFNADANPDVATANYNDGTVTVRFGDGLGGFGRPRGLVVGSGPSAIVSARLNGDARPDLVVVNSLSKSTKAVSVFINNGVGEFNRKTYAAGNGAHRVAIGKLNNDEKLDIAVANKGSKTVSVLIGTGTGAFGPPKSLPDIQPLRAPVSIAVMNVDGKWRDDIVVGEDAKSKVLVRLGDGTGAFPKALRSDAGRFATALTPFDAEGDGTPELAVGGGNIVVMRGGADGKLTRVSDEIPAPDVDSIAAGRLDGDDLRDLVFESAGRVGVVLHARDPLPPDHFVPELSLDFDTGGGRVMAGDFNGDGHRDLLVLNLVAGTVLVRLGNGAGGFGPAVAYRVGDQPSEFAVGDLNGDGRDDLGVVLGSGGGAVAVLLATAEGGFGQPAIYAAPGAAFVAIGNFDGAGGPDLAITILRPGSSVASVALRRGNGGGGFGDPVEFATTDGPARGLAVGHFDADRMLDLAVSHSPSASVLFGTGGGGLGPPGELSRYGVSIGWIVARDLNGDGIDELLAAVGAGDLGVWLSGPFGGPTLFPVLGGSGRFLVGDVDGNGALDIVEFVRRTVWVARGDGSGGFGTPVQVAVPAGTGDNPLNNLALGDVDGDALDDILLARLVNGVALLVTAGWGTVDPEPEWPVLHNPNLFLKSGIVQVTCPGHAAFQLQKPVRVPLNQPGCLIDTRKGVVTAKVAANTAGAFQTADFSAGEFRLTQRLENGQPMTVLRLSPATKCGTAAPVFNYLGGVGAGRWRTAGTWGTANPQVNSRWAMSERCGRNDFSVAAGRVTVRDIPLNKAVVLAAGQKYTAYKRNP